MENDPSQCFFTGAENRIKAGTGRTVCKEKSTRSFVGLDPWGLDPGAWKKPKLSKSEVNLKKVEKIHEKSKPVCEQSNR